MDTLTTPTLQPYGTDNEIEQAALVVVALAVLGEEKRRKARQKRRNYLRRRDLHALPRMQSAWQQLYVTRSEKAYVLTTGLDPCTFEWLLERFDPLWSSTPIERNDVNSNAVARTAARSLDSAGALGLVLHYLNSTMSCFTLQQVFAIVPSVCARYLAFSMGILERLLQTLPEAQISWPKEAEMFEKYADMIRSKYPLVENGFAFVDGLNLPVNVHKDEKIQNAYYNGWTCAHYISNIFCFAPDGSILYCNLNGPGSWHDAVMAANFYRKLLEKTPDKYYVIADTAFPRKARRLENRIKAPIKKGDRLPTNRAELARLNTFNNQLVSARQAAEWGMRAFQGSWSRLKMPMPAEDHQGRLRLLQVCARMHQVRTRKVGINQIKNVFEKVWLEGGSDIYQDFREMLFSDIERNDRISRYYNLVLE